MRTILLMIDDSDMDISPAMWRRNNRPVCRMWQMGRCPLNSIQCEFRHVDPSGSTAPPVLQEAFSPQPRTPDRVQSFGNQNVHGEGQLMLAEGFPPQSPGSPDDFGSHAAHRNRQPLREIVVPASLTEAIGLDGIDEEAGQSTWGSPRSSPRRWANGEMQPRAFSELSLLTDSSQRAEHTLTPIGPRAFASVASQNDASNPPRAEAEAHDGMLHFEFELTGKRP